ncbi:conserved unknown protein [Ectocarpus siliculosus]|uniref:FCP1 homology domain-containing protein n=1 Tax=Ectocarpus siliculosus TaxID=2880 RepID=D7FHQ5_ECTSI|nr:conserved unknown protein [Ectocarpus siliculosus]|eukprot:CBJ28610.1 conserved unknown protein [Ectocarpus siliculosus]
MPAGEGGETATPMAVDSSAPNAAAATSPRASSSAKSNGAVPSAGGGDGGGRARRSSSVVVYPEKHDAGKPKVFARQSFVASGEEEEMADTILQARQLAGQRRRSTFNANKKTAREGEIAQVAQNLAARRDSSAAATVNAAAGATANTATAAAGVAVDPADADAVARRRSSVMKLPDNLRALVQQSDASGVQKKTESPYNPQGASDDKAQTTTTDNTATTSSLNNTGSSTASTGSTRGRGWLSNVMTFIRWKKVPNSDRKRASRGGGGEEGGTPGLSPTPGKGGLGKKRRSLLPKQLPEFAGRKQLILDLDETLVHSSFKPVPGADFIMDIMVDGTFYKVFVLKRPGVDAFLERVAKLYEVIIFTASLPQYANPLLDVLDPKGTITSRLFREHCTFHEGYFVKDLTLLRHQSLESTIIVDNSPMAYMFQPENAIDCISWIDDREDTELDVIASFLETIVDVPDVRDLLEFWREGAAVLDNISS